MSTDEHYAFEGKDVTLLCGINTDDDVAGVLLTPSSGSTTEGSKDPVVFSVKLQTRPSSAVDVSSQLVGHDETEVGPVTLERTITPEQWDEVQQFEVFVVQPLIWGPIWGCGS